MLEARDGGYRSAEFIRIKDGDTFVARVCTWKLRGESEESVRSIRVRGWSAAELSEEEGPYMRDEFRSKLMNATLIELRATGRSFERIVCEVYLDGVMFDGLMKAALRRLRRKLARQRTPFRRRSALATSRRGGPERSRGTRRAAHLR